METSSVSAESFRGDIITERLEAAGRPLTIAHGGVDMEPSTATFRALTAAAEAAFGRISGGGIEAALAAVSVLEDDPSFNCGFGSVLARDGSVETDGAVSCGHSRRAVGVGAVPGLRHPARLAHRVFQEENAVLLVGRQAAEYAASLGISTEDLATEEQRLALAALAIDPSRSVFTGRSVPSETIGCLVVDGQGRVASASSTGGLLGKLPGRVGDACIAGAGFWTDERFGVLCSGSGEVAISRHLARSVADRASRMDILDATVSALEEVVRSGRTVCAVVAVDASTGAVATAHNGSSFPVVVRSAQKAHQLGGTNHRHSPRGEGQ